MITPIALYILSGMIFLLAAMFVAGDFGPGVPRRCLTLRMMLVAVAWPAALLWLIGAAAVDIARQLMRR